MTSWIETSLREAVEVLAGAGHPSLAEDLGRLVDMPAVTGIRVYRSSRLEALADALVDCDTLESLHRLIAEVAAAFDVSHCTIHLIRERSTAFYGTKVLTTFPKAWVAEYVDRRHSTIDPIIESCRRGTGTFFWDLQKASDDPITRHFIRAAIESGIGPSGISRVAETRYGSTIAVSLSSTLEQGVFRGRFQARLADFNEIAAELVDVFSDLACEHNNAPFNATDDQLKVLRALASGRSIAEVESLRFMYGSFKTVEKSILRSFGAKTLIQAAALASNRGILEDLPYFAEDVFPGAMTEPASIAAE
jgi:hypothetical protein